MIAEIRVALPGENHSDFGAVGDGERRDAYPSQFNPTTTIHYALPQSSLVTLSVYNALGQLVSTLVDAEEQPGYHEVKFDGSNLASGVYFYRLSAGSFVAARKLPLIL